MTAEIWFKGGVWQSLSPAAASSQMRHKTTPHAIAAFKIRSIMTLYFKRFTRMIEWSGRPNLEDGRPTVFVGPGVGDVVALLPFPEWFRRKGNKATDRKS